MARNFDAKALEPIMPGCNPNCPPGPKTPISPIVSVSSVNGENGDVVLKDLLIGAKAYNGSNEVHIYASDLGLEKAVVFIRTLPTKADINEELKTADAGDLFFCNEDGMFYLSVGEGDSKSFVSDMKIKDYSEVKNTASKIALEVDENTFKLTAKLYDLNGNIIFVSDPVLLPSGMDDVIKRGYYDAQTNEIVFILKNDTEVRVPLTGLIENLQPRITEQNKLAFDLVEGLAEFKVTTEQALAAEKQARINAVANEAVLREDADKAEEEARNAADQSLQEQLNTEIAERKTADEQIGIDLAAEVKDRKADDKRLNDRIDSTDASVTSLTNALASEVVARTQGDADLLTALRNEINARETADNEIKNLVSAEATTREQWDSALLNKLRTEESVRETLTTALRTDLDNEIAARKASDETLTGAISKEISDRTAAIKNEADLRYAKDKALDERIDKEISDRIAADDILQGNIEAEARERASQDGALLNKLGAEETARAEADTILQTNIDTERQNRIVNDKKLQEQIDNIPVYSLVKDAAASEYASVYHLTKDGVNEGDPITIPKDLFVKDAEVRRVDDENDPAHTIGNIPLGHTCIDLTVKAESAPTQEKHIYIDVTGLVDIYTAGDGIDIVNNVISVKAAILGEVGKLRTDLGNEATDRADADTLLRTDLNTLNGKVNSHTTNFDNPHGVTKSQVGLGNVNNTSDLDKPISTATQQAITAEETARKNAVSAEETARKTAVSAEEEARKAAVTAEETARKAADATEKSERETEDGKISAEVNKNAKAILTEAEVRKTKDDDLQDQINAINARKSHAIGVIVGDGSTTSFIVNHGLDTLDVITQVYDSVSGETIIVDSQRFDANSMKFTFAEAPAEGKTYRTLFYGMSDIIVAFNANGGTGSMPSLSATKNIAFTLPQCTFTAPEGKEFDVWAVNSAGGERVAAGSKYTSNVDVVFFAVWKDKVVIPNTFSGSVTSIPPTSVESLTGEFIEKATLIESGMTKNVSIAVGNDGFVTFAITNALNIELSKIEEQVGETGWQDITTDFITKKVGDYTFFYHKDITTGDPTAVYTYHITFSN